MDHQRFWLLVSLKLSGEASPAELAELELLIQQHPEAGLKLEAVTGIWLEAPSSPDLNHSFKAHVKKLKEAERQARNKVYYEYESTTNSVRERKSRLLYSFMAAASILIAVFCWVYFFDERPTLKDRETFATNTITTQKGSKTSIQLPDGTKVWLNADSKINYDETFKDNVREVRLEGEAFFDVRKDSSRPFIIHTSVIDIKVLGTKFNVKSYEDEAATETSLISGRVEISIKSNPEKKIILNPNEKLVVKHNLDDSIANGNKDDENALLLVKALRKDSSYEQSLETLWLDNKLVFDSEPLEEVCKKLERWYNVKINIQDERIKQETYTAIFDDETLLNVLTALKIADRLDFTITNNEVSIFRKK